MKRVTASETAKRRWCELLGPPGDWLSAEARRARREGTAQVTSVTAIISDAQRAIAVLAEHPDSGAVRVAQAIHRWLDGEAFDDAAGLPPGWWRHSAHAARNAVIAALVALYSELDDNVLATRTVGRDGHIVKADAWRTDNFA
jgi:hypothetical protein